MLQLLSENALEVLCKLIWWFLRKNCKIKKVYGPSDEQTPAKITRKNLLNSQQKSELISILNLNLSVLEKIRILILSYKKML